MPALGLTTSIGSHSVHAQGNKSSAVPIGTATKQTTTKATMCHVTTGTLAACVLSDKQLQVSGLQLGIQRKWVGCLLL